MFKHPKQFQILSLINCEIFNCDFSFTNFLLINILSLISFAGFIYYFSQSSGASQDTSIIDDLIRKIREVVIAIIREIRKKGGKVSKSLLRLLRNLLKKFIFWGLTLLDMALFWFCLAIIWKLLNELGLLGLDLNVLETIFLFWLKLFD